VGYCRGSESLRQRLSARVENWQEVRVGGLFGVAVRGI
jgi:hypothetical protein